MFKKQHLTQEEIKKLKEVSSEYNKLKKCLCIYEGDYDWDSKNHNLVQKLDLSNPIVKELSIIARKVDMILDNLGLKYSEEPSLLKMKKCVEIE